MNVSIELIQNQSCEELRLLGRQVLSGNTEVTLRYILLGYNNLLLDLLTVWLTVLPIYLIVKFKHLRHQITFFLALQLLILDLILGTIIKLTSFISVPASRWLLGLPLCSITGGIIAFSFQLKNWLMFVIVCDRFFTVFMPFNYHNKVRCRVISIFYFVVIILSLLASLPPAILGCHGFQQTIATCVNTPYFECPHHEYCQIHIIVEIATIQLFGSYIPLVMYIALFIKAKRIRIKLRKQTDIQEKAQQQTRDRRANITFFTIFMCLFGISFPFAWSYIALTAILLNPQGVPPPEYLLVITMVFQNLYAFSPIMDSIAIMRNAEVREALKKLQKRLIHCMEFKKKKEGTNIKIVLWVSLLLLEDGGNNNIID